MSCSKLVDLSQTYSDFIQHLYRSRISGSRTGSIENPSQPLLTFYWLTVCEFS